MGVVPSAKPMPSSTPSVAKSAKGAATEDGAGASLPVAAMRVAARRASTTPPLCSVVVQKPSMTTEACSRPSAKTWCSDERR